MSAQNSALKMIQDYVSPQEREVFEVPAPPPEHPALREYPSRLFVETTTRCNLKCRMCVKQTEGNCIAEGDMAPETFAALEPALPHTETLVLNGIGEPLLHRGLENFIRRAKELMPHGSWVGFQSNALLLHEARALSLAEAGVDRICLSMDGVNPDTFREIREGGEVADLERALLALEKAKSATGSALRVGIEFVVMRENARELPDVLRWAAAKGVSFAIVSHLLPYESEHMGSVAFDANSDEAVEFFKPWQERARREGLDLRRYFKILVKYLRARTAEEQKIVDLVQAMKDEARKRDIFIHWDNLLARDEGWIEELGAIFAEAQAVADEAGLELQLPAIMPRSERNCEFVDNGSAFISWDGGVHNCYFLWHRFSCYSSNSKKYVQPKVFGNVAEQGIKEIWNSTEFRSYRTQVLGKDYPICSNCNLVPCEYLYTENFEQDCYANTVACGDCYWCMGLYRCLQ
ncbi:radical SAM/SPASM family putative metalloenzyme maturase [Geomonas sp. RF6]|uniref:radical SAM/SPASM family putative metalloenzyme maturase n=1 Tax=Geomonas sp. RF6 TaxID=2897342 RepID=UPI001E650A5E|nr:radical SAM/SPASM family putative metalloenzyme maturase [Geomonas sp. RF6]UFS69079.1 radical SAM/SPASM family putative metalloenzyme maturase [Geomonas sp. RF6]